MTTPDARTTQDTMRESIHREIARGTAQRIPAAITTDAVMRIIDRLVGEVLNSDEWATGTSTAWDALYADHAPRTTAQRNAGEAALRDAFRVTVACDSCDATATVPALDVDLYDAVADGVVDGPDATGTVYIPCSAWPTRWTR